MEKWTDCCFVVVHLLSPKSVAATIDRRDDIAPNVTFFYDSDSDGALVLLSKLRENLRGGSVFNIARHLFPSLPPPKILPETWEGEGLNGHQLWCRRVAVVVVSGMKRHSH